jgi:hypothetical protein
MLLFYRWWTHIFVNYISMTSHYEKCKKISYTQAVRRTTDNKMLLLFVGRRRKKRERKRGG